MDRRATSEEEEKVRLLAFKAVVTHGNSQTQAENVGTFTLHTLDRSKSVGI